MADIPRLSLSALRDPRDLVRAHCAPSSTSTEATLTEANDARAQAAPSGATRSSAKRQGTERPADARPGDSQGDRPPPPETLLRLPQRQNAAVRRQQPPIE